jgi:hypothetical protein
VALGGQAGGDGRRIMGQGGLTGIETRQRYLGAATVWRDHPGLRLGL